MTADKAAFTAAVEAFMRKFNADWTQLNQSFCLPGFIDSFNKSFAAMLEYFALLTTRCTLIFSLFALHVTFLKMSKLKISKLFVLKNCNMRVGLWNTFSPISPSPFLSQKVNIDSDLPTKFFTWVNCEQHVSNFSPIQTSPPPPIILGKLLVLSILKPLS